MFSYEDAPMAVSQKNKGSQPFLFREKVHLNSLTENTNSGMMWTEEQQIFTFAGGAAQTAENR